MKVDSWLRFLLPKQVRRELSGGVGKLRLTGRTREDEFEPWNRKVRGKEVRSLERVYRCAKVRKALRRGWVR